MGPGRPETRNSANAFPFASWILCVIAPTNFGQSGVPWRLAGRRLRRLCLTLGSAGCAGPWLAVLAPGSSLTWALLAVLTLGWPAGYAGWLAVLALGWLDGWAFLRDKTEPTKNSPADAGRRMGPGRPETRNSANAFPFASWILHVNEPTDFGQSGMPWRLAGRLLWRLCLTLGSAGCAVPWLAGWL